MNNKQGFYLRTVKKTTFPRRFLFLDTETLKEKYAGIDIHRMRLGITCYIRLGDTPHKVQQEVWNFFDKQNTICQYIDKLSYSKSPLWIVASNPKFDLGAIAFIEYFTKHNWKLEFLGEKGLVFILSIKKGNKKIKVVAIQNYLSTSIARMGIWINKPKLDIDVFTDNIDLLKIYCFRDVEILMEAFLIYMCYVYDNEMGGFAFTKSAQGFMCFRHRFMTHKILIHKREKVSQFERTSYHGGRVECFRIGKQVKREYVQVDVNSLYPYVMRNNIYPSVLSGHVQKHNLEQLQNLLINKCVTARVLIKTNEPVYAKTIDKKCCFPTGIFWETLNTRALKYAFEHNHIIDVSGGIYYRGAPLFKRYIDYFWKERLKAQSEGNYVLQKLVKMFTNSFYGKWGQQVPILIKKEYEKQNVFEIEYWYNEETQQFGITRTLFHQTQVFSGKKDSKNTNVGISAHITEDARIYLWGLIKECGLENVYYCDTDSLIVSRETYNKYLKKYYGNELGQLKIEKVSNKLIIYTLKDYELGNKIVRKGIGKTVNQIDKDTYEVLTSYSLSTLMKLGLQDAAILTPVRKKLLRVYTKGNINVDGVVLPFQLNLPIDSEGYQIDSL